MAEFQGFCGIIVLTDISTQDKHLFFFLKKIVTYI